MDLPYEIRDPVHGFIGVSEWERDILNHRALQRLRRIRQLGLSEMVYPGSVHSRFEHSLGVMHVTSRMFDEVCDRSAGILADLRYSEAGLERQRVLLRIAALTHDVGHAPFSHAAEELMEGQTAGLRHEDYSAAIVREVLRDVIENHPQNRNYDIRADDVAALFEGRPELGESKLLWRDLLSGQLDADRADYLLRDSHHAGVEYGKFDLDRLLVCLEIVYDDESDGPRIGVSHGGWHVAEAFIIARYMMFMQVYFQHTRRAYDKHCILATKLVLEKAAKEAGRDTLLPGTMGEESLQEYLAWDDWRVLGRIKEGEGGAHRDALLHRNHFRRIFETPEVPTQAELEEFESLKDDLGEAVGFVDSASSSWYRRGEFDAVIAESVGTKRLSQLSSIVGSMRPVNQYRIYVPQDERAAASRILARFRGGNE